MRTSFFSSCVFCFHSLLTFGQQFGQLPLKEDYDRYTQQLVKNYKPCTISTEKDHTVFGDGMAYVLDGYLTMYETTQDKDYLFKFINQSACILENRHDLAGISNEPRWGDITYEEGNIIGTFSKFVHLVKIKDKALQSLKIHPLSSPINYSLDVGAETFGDYALWLQGKIEETLDWFIQNGYWNDQLGFLEEPFSSSSLIINKHIGFAKAVLFLSLSGEDKYASYSNTIESLFFSQVQFYDRHVRKEYNEPLFLLNDKNAIWWYHFGWTEVRKKRKIRFKKSKGTPSIEKYTSFYEDISHGAIVMSYPIIQWENNPITRFNQRDLIYFHRTFTQNIYDGKGGFFNAVNGEDNPISDNYCKECPHNYHALKSLMYAPYCSFDAIDSSTINVYDVLMKYYQKNVMQQAKLPSGYCCGINSGHAELVKFQWLNEEENLTIFNRFLVYEQDFNAEGSILIAPENAAGESYAEPIISDKKFIVDTGVKTTLSAGKSIQLKTGVHFKSGSNVNVKINKY
jgi:hypothetical protein